MAQKFWYYIDFGSGYVEINSTEIEINTQLVWLRGELNDFISRKKLEGNFLLAGSAFTLAETHFLTNGFEEAAIRIYENGNSGSGVLQFEGWARTSGEWDFRESKVTFDTFRTSDQYTLFLEKWNNSHIGESLVGFGGLGPFASQGQHVNANKLHAITWNGTDFSITAGTPYSIPNLGRCCVDRVGTEINLFDSVNNTLSSYVISGGQWSQVRFATVPVSTFDFSSCAIAPTSATTFDLYSDRSDIVLPVSYSGATGYSFGSFSSIEEIKFPSACWTGARIAIVDEEQRKIRTGNNSIDVGEVKRPQVCVYNEITEWIAFIDARLRNLQMYQYSAGAYSKVGNPLYISGLLAPTISRYNPTGDIMIHDTIQGTLKMYTFNGTDWSQVGNTFNIGGGYMSAITHYSTDIMLAISDTHTFVGSVMSSMYGLTNSLLLQENIWGTGVGDYEMLTAGTGATKNPNDVIFGKMSDIADNFDDSGDINTYRFKLNDTLKWYEVFQNYWYIEDGAGAASHKIKFTQPDSFSTFGADIDISSLTSVVSELNKRRYIDEFKIDQEELIFNNANNSDFEGNKIDYQRKTSVTIESAYPFTTDLEYLIKIYTGEVIGEINTGGLIVYVKDNALSPTIAVGGTGIISGSDVKNIEMSQSQIYNDYWDTYRYSLGDTANNQIIINGSPIPTPGSVRNIIEYTDVQFSESDVSITQFPASIASLIWGGGVPKSLIMKLSLDMNTRIYTASSRRHDI